MDTGDHQTEDDDAANCEGKDQPSRNVVRGVDVTKPDGEDGNVAEVQCIDKCPAFDLCKNTSTSSKPNKEHHCLKDKVSLFLCEFEVLSVVTQEVSLHVHHEHH